MDYSVQINKEKEYLIHLGIDKRIVNSEFDKTFEKVSDISLLREELILSNSDMIREFQKKQKEDKKKKKRTSKSAPVSAISKALTKQIKDKTNCLLDFGIPLDVINDAFNEREIKSARQLDVIGENLLSKYFAALDVLDVVKAARV